MYGMIFMLVTLFTMQPLTAVNCSGPQVWEEVDQGGADQREADGGSAHWNPMGICDLHCFRQRQTSFL